MQRKGILTAGLALIALFGVAPALLGAQQSEPISGVGGGPIGQGQPKVAPGHILSLRRAIFEPGGYVATHHHSGPLVLYVESGELTYGPVATGDVENVRGELYEAGEGTPIPTERLGVGDETVLQAGDWLYEGSDVVHSVRNDAGAPAVVWLAALWATDQPGLIFHEDATPAP
jgi:quercetin dioxygenase-like cupin family protein